jgi:hypothetical protein
MTHDPLCPWRQAEESDGPNRWLTGVAVCECGLIAMVREDMLAKCIAAVEAVHSPIPIDEHLSFCRGCAEAVSYAAYEEYSYEWPCAVVTALRDLQTP